MTELMIYVGFFFLLFLVVFAHSTNRVMRFLGLSVLFLISLGLISATLGCLYSAMFGPRFNGGMGNFGMFFLAIPFGFFSFFSTWFFVDAFKMDPEASRYNLTFTKLWQVLKFLLGLGR